MAMAWKILIFAGLIALVAAKSPVKKIEDLVKDKAVDAMSKKWDDGSESDSKKALVKLSKKKDEISDVSTKILLKSTLKGLLALMGKVVKLLDVIGLSIVKDKASSKVSKHSDSWGPSEMHGYYRSDDHGKKHFDFKDFGIKGAVSDKFEIFEVLKDLLKAHFFKKD